MLSMEERLWKMLEIEADRVETSIRCEIEQGLIGKAVV